MKRYYAPALDRGVLDAEQAHHCSDVMRQKVGDLFSVFNGEGVEAKARITAISRDEVKFETLARAVAVRPAHPVWLAQALTKKNAMELILQKATELGVAEIVPLQSDHSVAQVDDEKSDAKLEKWRKLTIEAAKQCGQNWLPRVHAPLTPREFMPGLPKNALKLIASLQAEAKPLKSVLREQLGALKPGTPIVVMIGPEGDFTPAEIGTARAAGFAPVSLGKIILRAETAAVFTLGAISYELMAD
jgi:16S rRNA (uracil1498-N3)-methyltransferase